MTTFNDIQALHAEVLALRNANVPVDIGVWSHSMEIASLTDVGTHVDSQDADVNDLEESLAELDLPLRYRNILLVGARSGRLPVAVETIANHLRRMRNVQSEIAAALVYPLVICVLGYGFLVFLYLHDASPLRALNADILLPSSTNTSTRAVDWIMETAPAVTVFSPILFVLAIAAWWLPARQGAHSLEWSMGAIGWVPGVRRVVRDTQWSGIARMAAMLVENGVVAEQAADTASKAIVGGRLNSPPPFFRWALEHSATSPTRRADQLRLAGKLYEGRAQQQAEWLRVLLPFLFLIFVGGGTVLVYVLAFWWPFCLFLLDLSSETTFLHQ